jgi:glucose-1-phosphate adenylyltransferase
MRPRALALVLAGGAGGRLELLTTHRAKPAVPYGGTHRLVDVALSCCAHAGVADVWLLQQHHPASLSDHLANGRPWDLDRTEGGLLVLHPAKGTQREGWHEGTADALWRIAPLVRQLDPDVLLLLSADAVYRMDYDALVTAQGSSAAPLTMVTAAVPAGEDPGRFGVVAVVDGRVTHYANKPERPASDLISTEVFAARPGPLLDVLEELADGAGEEALQDLGDGVLPALVDTGNVREHRHQGYWRDVGTVASYWRGHQELLGEEPAFALDDGALPLRTRVLRTGPGRLRASAEVADVLLAPSADVAGVVERSVLGAGVVVEPGAVVRDSVLLPGAVVRRGAVVERAVLDDQVVVERGVAVGGPAGRDEAPADGVALVGKGQQVTNDLPAGGRCPAGDP